MPTKTQQGKTQKPAGTRRAERGEAPKIEQYNSPKTRHTDENASTIFSAFLFILAAALVLCIGWALTGGVNIWTLVIALTTAVLATFTIRIAPQWERVVILRFGKHNRTVGPGLYMTIPFIEHIALRADQRVMLTGFGAEETLTADLVPVNVDAVVFWMVWDAQKAALEVEDYYDSVMLASQTALRDAIGRKSIADVAVHRDQLDAELREKIEEKTSVWGVSVLSVELRNIVIPKDLQEAMSAEARAEREKDARVVLAEVEQDIAAMLLEASKIYREDELALRLRQMHLLNESMKESKGSVVVPSAYAEGFVEEAAGKPASK